MPRDDTLFLLGIDTGGTYTDAVLIDEGRLDQGPAALISQAKRLTTRDDLARGIDAAIGAVLGGRAPERIGLVSLSTTLATNALVEGKGGRVALVMIGFAPADLGRAGLDQALGRDPLIAIAGGHTPMGDAAAPLDLDTLAAALQGIEVEAFAICGYFAVRNPEHEMAARDLIRARTGRPVTCSHELSAQIGGPKRALTALLNARLIGLLDRLISAAQGLLAARGIAAPLMVVRGDGALVSAEFARTRPIETILSGPAASLVGAAWLTGLGDAIVSDIGGTTTDIAILRGGRPRLDPAGARVGGWRTMVQAVAMTTHGLGGDSEVALADDGLDQSLTLGPRRVVPVSLLALDHGAMVHAALDRQMARETPGELDGRFLMADGTARALGLEPGEQALVDRLAGGPLPMDEVLTGRMQRTALKRLLARGLVLAAGLTPSDAAHVLGLHQGWDGAAARKACALFARRRTNRGSVLAEGAEALAGRIVAALTRRSAELVLDAALAEDGFDLAEPSRTPLAAAALDGHAGLVRPRLGLSVPLIGLGASAPTYYPGVAALLEARPAIPPEAGVANAIGAVVGRVRVSHSAVISVPAEGRYRAHLTSGAVDFADFAMACAHVRAALAALAREDAARAGADEVELAETTEISEAEVEGRRMLIEATLIATATGRPRLAEPAPEPDLPAGFRGA